MDNRIIGRDLPTFREPATTTEIYAAISYYDAAIGESETLIAQARASYRSVWLSRLEAYHRLLIHERGVWRDALTRSAAQPRPLAFPSMWNHSARNIGGMA